jgi:hypothetical protein
MIIPEPDGDVANVTNSAEAIPAIGWYYASTRSTTARRRIAGWSGRSMIPDLPKHALGPEEEG